MSRTTRNNAFIPTEIISIIVEFLPLTTNTLLSCERISKQFYTCVGEYWPLLWNELYPSNPLRKNHRFACIQMHIYLLRYEKPNTWETIRIVVAGAPGVGKSALCLRFITGGYHAQYDPTIEDVYEKQIDINGAQRTLVIVDTAASDDYVALRDYDCLHGDALLLCCDLQMQDSIENMEYKLSRFLYNSAEPKYVMISVNKMDLGVTGFSLSMQDVQRFANKHSIFDIVQTSVLDNTNVSEIFNKIASGAMNILVRNPKWISKLENGETILPQPKSKCSIN